MHRRPAVEEYFPVVNFRPILDFLFADVRGKLRVLAQALEVCARYAQRHAFGAGDAICIGVEPGLVRELITARTGKSGQFERGLYAWLIHRM